MALQAETEKQGRHIESLDFVAYVLDDGKGVRLNDDVITFDEMAAIVDYLRTSTDKKKDLFEECWVAYRRKGIKKKAKEQWNKLKESEMDMVMPHIKAYVSSREIQYQKDFERYLRDRVFMEVVYSGNNIIYDPTKAIADEKQVSVYVPTCGGMLNWNDYYKCYLYTGYWNGYIPDGYTDSNRPDGASVMLNNARGTVVWNANAKTWEVIK